MSDIATLLRDATQRLADAGVEAPGRDARILLSAAADLDRASLIATPERVLDARTRARFDTYIARRIDRVPTTKILGRTGFWTQEITTGADVLDPRPDTETLIEATLALRPDRNAAYRILDLGTGSGCILAALLGEYRNAVGLALDRSAAALRIARRNFEDAGLSGRTLAAIGDWGAAARAPFDIVVSNPPYIPSREIATLEPEVRRHDPLDALDGGEDGLDCYRAILADVPRLLMEDGLALLEVGRGQAGAVAHIARGAGLDTLAPYTDLGGVERVIACVPTRP